MGITIGLKCGCSKYICVHKIESEAIWKYDGLYVAILWKEVIYSLRGVGLAAPFSLILKFSASNPYP